MNLTVLRVFGSPSNIGSDKRSQLSKDSVSRLGKSTKTLPKATSAAASSSISCMSALSGRCETVR
jgi:hypothetical protein